MTAMTTAPWLSIVGIGDDGLDGLSPAAKACLAASEVLVGGDRHLAMVPPDDRPRLSWPVPWDAELAQIVALRGRRVCVLATGDPFWCGVGASLARHIPPAEMTVHPAPSAFALAAARMAWPLDRVDTLSLHGRDPALLHPLLYPGARLLVLSQGGQTLHDVAGLLTARGFGPSRITVLEHMGGPRERRRTDSAERIAGTPSAEDTVADLNTLAIDCIATDAASAMTRVPGLPETAFAHDGKITKPEARATAIAALAPYPGALLWDIGAGCGSVAIEWMRSDPRSRAIAVERAADRIALLRANATALGTPGITVIEGEAPAVLAGLPTPDAVFIGGGMHDPALWETCWARLRPGGRLAVNAVTLESEQIVLDRHARIGGRLIRLSVAQAGPVGSYRGWRQQMPVTQWTVTKPWHGPGPEDP